MQVPKVCAPVSSMGGLEQPTLKGSYLGPSLSYASMSFPQLSETQLIHKKPSTQPPHEIVARKY